MELDLQTLFRLHVTRYAQLFSLAEAPQPPTSPRILGSYTRGGFLSAKIDDISSWREQCSLFDHLCVQYICTNVKVHTVFDIWSRTVYIRDILLEGLCCKGTFLCADGVNRFVKPDPVPKLVQQQIYCQPPPLPPVIKYLSGPCAWSEQYKHYRGPMTGSNHSLTALSSNRYQPTNPATKSDRQTDKQEDADFFIYFSSTLYFYSKAMIRMCIATLNLGTFYFLYNLIKNLRISKMIGSRFLWV